MGGPTTWTTERTPAVTAPSAGTPTPPCCSAPATSPTPSLSTVPHATPDTKFSINCRFRQATVQYCILINKIYRKSADFCLICKQFVREISTGEHYLPRLCCVV